ncbi:hypothetical protein FNV43_RR06919 [Rhamnella rubrinervis]|uniref:Uncharacterized protein n=1 Tax=Rhamnella rubrinervis TaxID=2594499 RepID=A0A8K0MMF6_9ROSA|nr:hypothetical protein FNV43_RR06919 [Rhamnella rubrinervis]
MGRRVVTCMPCSCNVESASFEPKLGNKNLRVQRPIHTTKAQRPELVINPQATASPLPLETTGATVSGMPSTAGHLRILSYQRMIMIWQLELQLLE